MVRGDGRARGVDREVDRVAEARDVRSRSDAGHHREGPDRGDSGDRGEDAAGAAPDCEVGKSRFMTRSSSTRGRSCGGGDGRGGAVSRPASRRAWVLDGLDGSHDTAGGDGETGRTRTWTRTETRSIALPDRNALSFTNITRASVCASDAATSPGTARSRMRHHRGC